MPAKSIDTPLAEITLRRYESPHNLSARDLSAKMCLSLGVLQPGDSRDVIIDVLYVLLQAAKDKVLLSSIEVRNRVLKVREEMQLTSQGTADSNIRRQLKRLREVYLVEKIKNNYRINEFTTLEHLIGERIERMLLPALISRIKEYAKACDETFQLKP